VILDVEQLKKAIILWEIEKQTKEQFLLNFNNYMVEQKEEFYSYFGEFKQGDLDYYIKKISLELKNFPELNYIHLVSNLWVEYMGEVVGEYRLFFTLEGEVCDFDLIIF